MPTPRKSSPTAAASAPAGDANREAVTNAPAAPRVHAPGTIPSRVAERFGMPDILQRHYSEVYPDSVPQPHETAPGVFVNRDGSPYTPREIKGGQFAALLLRVGGKFGGPQREIGLPLSVQPSEYPIKAHERVISRTEVVFDFEDQMQEFLAQWKNSTADPLKTAFARGGVDPELYDSTATSTEA